ncbi:DUF2207 domain-containing protein [Silvanigrella aquatica]|uniref:Uncharacterized protein n=1 Tax=Silvanigrella aquatica TaxID=1915309 RepID=A0A1L4D3G5_9BACT|nr:DUF2207 domain-containing protein [Silvanigrella aquatica]APJ04743.1 hypothetical protein AXG55_12890 [Silvanigrella aquatica]
MNQVSLLQLRETADQLILLAGTFQIKPHYLRAKQIRQADKSLIAVDAFFSKELATEAKQWVESVEGLRVLRKKLSSVEEKQNEIEELDVRINALKLTIQPWTSLEDNERQKIIQNAKRAQDFVHNHLEKTEAHIIHRYNRFSALKELSPYADNANYLCEAVFHYENREKYEANIEKIEKKNIGAKERLKTVNRGFWLAIIFCIFILTIPICFLFALSLWKRKKEIENQIANSDETLRRENKRLIAAEEGAVVAQDIRSHLGEISLEQIRDTLAEVRDLRAEFQGPERTTSSTAILLSFIDLHKIKLAELFGDIPENPVKTFKWLSDYVNKYQNTEATIHKLMDRKAEVIQQQKQLTKGYSPEILLTSIRKLELVLQNTMQFPFDQENKSYFSDICINIPAILAQVREVLFFVSRSHPIDTQYWNMLRLKIQGFSNIMSLCVLDAEISNLNYDSLTEAASENVGEVKKKGSA